jgi:hypothetical protein
MVLGLTVLEEATEGDEVWAPKFRFGDPFRLEGRLLLGGIRSEEVGRSSSIAPVGAGVVPGRTGDGGDGGRYIMLGLAGAVFTFCAGGSVQVNGFVWPES